MDLRDDYADKDLPPAWWQSDMALSIKLGIGLLLFIAGVVLVIELFVPKFH